MVKAKSLREELIAYHGRNPKILSEIIIRRCDQKGFLSDLITLALDKEPIISEGATWILKAELEKGQHLSRQDVNLLIFGLKAVTTWQAQLHICQSIQYLAVPQESAPDLEQWLEALLEAKRPLLRAWSVDALCRVRGSSSPKTKTLLEQMETDDAGSVRARIRNLKREFDAGQSNCFQRGQPNSSAPHRR